jgi:hypothetical protein
MNEPKEYEKPEIVEELDLETKAGSPACPPTDPLEITKPIC